MKQILFGGIAGAVVLFIWGALAWTVLPLHRGSLHALPNEDVVIEILRATADRHAVYIIPARPQESPEMSAEQRDALMQEFQRKYERGPIGLLVYNPRGASLTMAGQFVGGFIINFIAAFLAAWFLSRSTAAASSYVARVAFCGMLGVFVSVATHLPNWNWLGFPLDYTTASVADAVIGWLLAGLAIAAIVKVPKMESA